MKHFYTKISTMFLGLMAWSQVQGSDYVVDFTVDGVNYAKTSDTEVMIVGADKYGKKRIVEILLSPTRSHRVEKPIR